MKHKITFEITFEDGWYTASALDYGIVTQGHTFEELVENVQEATSLYLEGEESELTKENVEIFGVFEIPFIFNL